MEEGLATYIKDNFAIIAGVASFLGFLLSLLNNIKQKQKIIELKRSAHQIAMFARQNKKEIPESIKGTDRSYIEIAFSAIIHMAVQIGPQNSDYYDDNVLNFLRKIYMFRIGRIQAKKNLKEGIHRSVKRDFDSGEEK